MSMILILFDIPVLLYTTKPAIGLFLIIYMCVGAHGIFCGKRQTIFFIVADEKQKLVLVSRLGRIAHIPRYIYSYQKVKGVYICYLLS